MQRITQAYNDSIDIHAPGCGSASYRFNPTMPKPAWHPITTAAGTVLSGFEPSDHVWHRGLWFTIKFINKDNFWEEHPPFGVQRSVAHPTVEILSPHATRITHQQLWSSDRLGQVIRETRTQELHSDLPGTLRFDFHTHLTALTDLELDRTPFTTWGGYGGLTLRMSRELHGMAYQRPDASAPKEPNPESVTSEHHDWLLLHAKVDGGPSRSVSVGFIEHPSNLRSPTPWYCRGVNGYNFMNAAFLFHEPLLLPANQSLQLRYRIYIRDGVWDKLDFARLADHFRQS